MGIEMGVGHRSSYFTTMMGCEFEMVYLFLV